MRFPSSLSTVAALLKLSTLACAQIGDYGFRVSDCDGTTNAKTYFANRDTITNPVCVQWPDGNFLINEKSSTAEGFTCDMWIYADDSCQVDPILYPSGCYVNIGSFAILCALTSTETAGKLDL